MNVERCERCDKIVHEEPTTAAEKKIVAHGLDGPHTWCQACWVGWMTTEKVRNVARWPGQMFVVRVGGRTVGVLTKLRDTRTTRNPWKAYRGNQATSESYLSAFDDRLAALAAIADVVYE